jgi:hypothetical protein
MKLALIFNILLKNTSDAVHRRLGFEVLSSKIETQYSIFKTKLQHVHVKTSTCACKPFMEVPEMCAYQLKTFTVSTALQESFSCNLLGYRHIYSMDLCRPIRRKECHMLPPGQPKYLYKGLR